MISSRLVSDQTTRHHSQAKLTHKCNHHTRLPLSPYSPTPPPDLISSTFFVSQCKLHSQRRTFPTLSYKDTLRALWTFPSQHQPRPVVNTCICMHIRMHKTVRLFATICLPHCNVNPMELICLPYHPPPNTKHSTCTSQVLSTFLLNALMKEFQKILKFMTIAHFQTFRG